MLLRVSKKRDWPSAEFPFSVPAVRAFSSLELGAVTFFVGENGSGKSTLLEAIATVAELPSLGGDGETLASQRELGAHLRLSWSPRTRAGFFMRAEDFFGYLKLQARIDARIVRERRENDGHVGPLFDDNARHIDEVRAARHLGRYDARSHGESFLELFKDRVRRGLYLLDEPEAPLSPTRQLALLHLLRDRSREGAQFVIATHSPILLACPGAKIVSFDRAPIAEVAYEDLEHVAITRAFLNDPSRFT